MVMTADQDYRPNVGVHLILIQDERVLLLQRANTGFADGDWSVPGGRLAQGETLPHGAAREALEELAIHINPDDLTFVHLCHHADPDGQARIGVFFTATRWTGTPVNAEPDRCSQIDWFVPCALPGNTVGYIRTGIHSSQNGASFSLHDW
jgi:ADP-ribose pyrophosphatase YjhB (NUDIX family)